MKQIQILRDAGYGIGGVREKVIEVLLAFDADGETWLEIEGINNSPQAARGFIKRHGKPSKAHCAFLKLHDRWEQR